MQSWRGSDCSHLCLWVICVSLWGWSLLEEEEVVEKFCVPINSSMQIFLSSLKPLSQSCSVSQSRRTRSIDSWKQGSFSCPLHRKKEVKWVSHKVDVIMLSLKLLWSIITLKVKDRQYRALLFNNKDIEAFHQTEENKDCFYKDVCDGEYVTTNRLFSIKKNALQLHL